MTEPTREQIAAAYEALESLTDTCIHSSDLAEELQELVLLALPPKPQPTMADVEWDDDKHYLAEAQSISGIKVVMLHRVTDTQILCLGKGNSGHWTYYYSPEALTLTGKRYTLTEVQDD